MAEIAKSRKCPEKGLPRITIVYFPSHCKTKSKNKTFLSTLKSPIHFRKTISDQFLNAAAYLNKKMIISMVNIDVLEGELVQIVFDEVLGVVHN
jgi:hypothetical protein